MIRRVPKDGQLAPGELRAMLVHLTSGSKVVFEFDGVPLRVTEVNLENMNRNQKTGATEGAGTDENPPKLITPNLVIHLSK